MTQSNADYIRRSSKAEKDADRLLRSFMQNRHKAHVNEQVTGKVFIYTDGACYPNPGPGGWGFVMIMPNGREVEFSGYNRDTTNNRMELQAAISALEAAPKSAEVRIISDSRYLVDGITLWLGKWKKNGWKCKDRTGKGRWKFVNNDDLWKKLDALLESRQATFSWVRGHDKNKYNERADRLATKAAQVAI